MPASILPGQRTPLVFIQTDNSLAGSSSSSKQSLLVGSRLAAGTLAAGTLTQITGQIADTEYGVGSMLARMVRAFRANNPQGTLWCIPLDDNGAAVAATGTITVVGTATADGNFYVYVAGQLITAVVTSGDNETAVAAAITTAAALITQLPVTVANVAGVITFTSKNDGETANDIHLGMNLLGAGGGEVLPAGITFTGPVAMASGATNPVVTAAITAMAGEQFDFIACPYEDTANLDLWETELSFTGGRWSETSQEYGHLWSATRGTAGALTTFGNLRADPHVSIFGMEVAMPTPGWEVCSQVCGQASKAFSAGPGAASRPLQFLTLIGARAPLAVSRFTILERQTLLTDGIATLTHKRGITKIERSITTYQLDGAANPDDSYLDVTTLMTLQEINERISDVMLTKYPRHKLVNDGTKFDSGQAVVTPGVIRGELVSLYRTFEFEALVENADAFIAALTVTRDIGDPNRLNVLYTPDLANQLRVFALLNQFRLQFAG